MKFFEQSAEKMAENYFEHGIRKNTLKYKKSTKSRIINLIFIIILFFIIYKVVVEPKGFSSTDEFLRYYINSEISQEESDLRRKELFEGS